MFLSKLTLPTSPSRPSEDSSFESDGNYAIPGTAAATRGIGGGKNEERREEPRKRGQAERVAPKSQMGNEKKDK